MTAARPARRFVALLKGVNVGRGKRVPMAEWRSVMESLGYGDVRTLLNSGNAAFTAAGTQTAAGHAARIHAAVAQAFGVETLVIVKSASDIAAVVAGNDWGATAHDASRLLVVFTADAQALAALAAAAAAFDGGDELRVGRHAAYLWCPDGSLQSKVGAAVLGTLGHAATTRNWATVGKLHALVSQNGA